MNVEHHKIRPHHAITHPYYELRPEKQDIESHEQVHLNTWLNQRSYKQIKTFNRRIVTYYGKNILDQAIKT